MQDPSFGSTSYSPDRLVGGDLKLITREVTLTDIGATGPLVRGTVLGMIAADERYGVSLAASGDGSESPRAILAIDADPSGGDVTALIYDQGEFNANALTIGTGHTVASIREALRALSIHLKVPVAAV